MMMIDSVCMYVCIVVVPRCSLPPGTFVRFTRQQFHLVLAQGGS